MALTITPKIEKAEVCPDFNLLGVDGKKYSRKDFQNFEAVVFMFICNHCPYVKAIEDRLITLGHDLKKLNIALVAICSNDSKTYIEDSYENLQKRSQEKNYSFIYLHDESQEAAKSFGAVCTPDYFVYDKSFNLKYRGRLDDSWKDPNKVTRRELFEATKKIAAGEILSEKQTPSMGCSIKWT